VIELLTLADWPGNVRDLRESVYHAYLLARAERSDAIRADHLPPHVRPELRWCRHECRDARRRVVAAALAVTDDDVGTAAHRLGVHRNTVMRLRT
jgi:transcriptional regulator with PAS, ATPase and Fis domain